MASFTVVVMVWAVSLAMTTIEPAEKLNNWSLLASTGNMVRYVIEKNLVQSDWDGRKIYQEAAATMLFARKPFERMNNPSSRPAQYQ